MELAMWERTKKKIDIGLFVFDGVWSGAEAASGHCHALTALLASRSPRVSPNDPFDSLISRTHARHWSLAHSVLRSFAHLGKNLHPLLVA